MGRGHDAPDPLAELARLVSQDDPYRNVFRPAAVPATDAERSWHEDSGQPSRHHADGARDDDAARRDGGAHDDDPHGYGQHAYGDDADGAEPGWPHHRDPEGAGPHDLDQRYAAADYMAHRDDAGIADEGAATDAAAAAIPDIWARQDDGRLAPSHEIDEPLSAAHLRSPDRATARRPLIALAAVLVLTGGGLAASFLAKGSVSATAASSRAAPTILAATGPIKVKQDDPGGTAPEDKDAALLNKNSGAASGTVKVVQSEEQPVDLGQLPKADPSDGAGSSAQAASPFPEPKKVKTFVVRLDGSTLSEDGTLAAPAAPAPDGTAVTSAAPAPAQPTAVAVPVEAPPPPKSATQPVATPKPTTIASLAAGDAAIGTIPAAAAAKPDKAQTAAAGAGGFGLQLAASPSEADAHAVFAKLKKKYPSELGSLSASVHKSETGGKPVYRVRVGGMTRAEAGDLCGKLHAGGGSCYVVRD